MIIALTLIGLAFIWMLFELDFFRINLMGETEVSEYTPSELLTLESSESKSEYVPSTFVPCDVPENAEITTKTVVNIGAKIL